jgi:hypothetical protein
MPTVRTTQKGWWVEISHNAVRNVLQEPARAARVRPVSLISVFTAITT